jgi:hypothetical protein
MYFHLVLFEVRFFDGRSVLSRLMRCVRECDDGVGEIRVVVYGRNVVEVG